MMKREPVFTKDLQNRKLNVQRTFDAPLELVWRAWTESEILDQWWAPHPYQAKTKIMDFKEGGMWLYCMVGPKGDEAWCRVNYLTIRPQDTFTGRSHFCDEEGNENPGMPEMNWKNQFVQTGEETTVNVELTFNKETDLETIINMGFQEGFTAGLSNLDQYLSTHFRLRKEMKAHNAARVATYLNFPGNTEEAFTFYKDVFNGEFTGRGLQRFGDLTLPAEMPPMSDTDKKLIIHAELTIMGGYVLMATDAPESMGFKLEKGNNMHINLEPESRKETLRLFEALSAGGTVTMPLQDMFWGAYYAAFTDRYGVNWMLNYQPNNGIQVD